MCDTAADEATFAIAAIRMAKHPQVAISASPDGRCLSARPRARVDPADGIGRRHAFPAASPPGHLATLREIDELAHQGAAIGLESRMPDCFDRSALSPWLGHPYDSDRLEQKAGPLRTMQSVGVIIVNYRTAPLVIENLSALAVERERLDDQLRVYVVDNDSRDGSVQLLATAI